MSDLILLGDVGTWLFPTWVVGVGAVAVLLGIAAFYFLLQLFLPKVAAVALTTTRAALAHPLFYVELLIGVMALAIFFPIIPYYTFGEDVKMHKDSGMTLIMVLGIIMALWTASTSISEELEGRTALTLLSKPIKRWHFIIGKFLGTVGPVILLFVLLGSLLLVSVSYKVSYDSRETGSSAPTQEECREEMIQTVPGLLLAFMETVVLTSIGVAISTRLPMLPNLVICATIYVVGHLVPLLVNSGAGRFQIVQFMSYFIGTALPILEYYSIQGAVTAGREVPWDYLAWAGVYAALYCTLALLAALFLFEDRDLA